MRLKKEEKEKKKQTRTFKRRTTDVNPDMNKILDTCIVPFLQILKHHFLQYSPTQKNKILPTLNRVQTHRGRT